MAGVHARPGGPRPVRRRPGDQRRPRRAGERDRRRAAGRLLAALLHPLRRNLLTRMPKTAQPPSTCCRGTPGSGCVPAPAPRVHATTTGRCSRWPPTTPPTASPRPGSRCCWPAVTVTPAPSPSTAAGPWSRSPWRDWWQWCAAGGRSKEDFQACKNATGLDKGQVTTWTSWSTAALVAYAFLAIATAREHTQAGQGGADEIRMTPLTCHELLRLLRLLILPAPRRDAEHVLH